MSTLLVSLEVLPQNDLEFIKLCDEATHVDVQTWGDRHSPKRPFSQLRGLIFNGKRYEDRGAGCACSKIRLFKFGDDAYTVCTEHGLQSIGYLRSIIVNGKSRKGVKP